MESTIQESGIQKRYLTVKETADILGVNIKTIYRAIAAGEIPSRRIRRSVRVPRYAVITDGEQRHGEPLARGRRRGTVLGHGRVAPPEG